MVTENSENVEQPIDSTAFFKIIWRCAIATGQHGLLKLSPRAAVLYRCWGLVVQVFLMFGFPATLALASFQSPDTDVNIRNFSMMILCIVCSMKFKINMYNIDRMYAAESMWRTLDGRITTPEDRKYFQGFQRIMHGIPRLFLFFYFLMSFSGQLAVMSQDENTLMFNARFPFDWSASNRNYQIANAYQSCALSLHLLLNFFNDCYPPMTLYLLTEHVELLAHRFSRIGADGGTTDDNEKELLRCIKDHKIITRLFDTLQAIHKWPIFLQFVVTAFSLCVGMVLVALMFYNVNIFERLHFLVYFICTTLEILPICYYGTHLDYVLEQLHGSVYQCHWIEQSRTFKKHMIFFTERTLKPKKMMAGNMIGINLNFFIATMKGAYSLFTILSSSKTAIE